MDTSAKGLNVKFPIYKADGTSFEDLVLHKSAFESVVMSLGDKITGDVYYKNNSLVITMQEYIVYEGVHYVLVNPPTIVREGLVKDNSEAKGLTKYSFTFYHPMYMLGNFEFTDVAVEEGEERYLAQNKTFSWIGYLRDFVDKLNANLANTQWIVRSNVSVEDDKLSEVLSFDNVMIADALKTCYDTWKVPFVIDQIKEGEAHYSEGKRYLVLFGLPSNEIATATTETVNIDTYLDSGFFCSTTSIELHSGDVITLLSDVSAVAVIEDTMSGNRIPLTDTYKATRNVTVYIGHGGGAISVNIRIASVFIFRMGQGVGLKNNSRTPKNNKIVTRISGYGSENNIPWGYPQIVWTGDINAKFTYGDHAGTYENVTIGGRTYAKLVSYPIYDGIVNGQQVKLIKHPFTRNHLMPSVYRESVDKKVNPYNEHYDCDAKIIDYYDAIDNVYMDSQGNPITFPNNVDPQAPSYEIHQFEDIKPELGNNTTLSADAVPYTTSTEGGYVTKDDFDDFLEATINASTIAQEKDVLSTLVDLPQEDKTEQSIGGAYTYKYEVKYLDDYFLTVKYESSGVNFVKKVLYQQSAPTPQWDDTMDDDGNYAQSYFKMTLPELTFDLYACASITEEMKINMRSGACIGCTFPIMVDWEDYKKNFYDSDGNFVPYSGRRNYDKYPDSSQGSITVICQKEYETFGTIMPNVYQQPKQGDIIVFLGISLPQSYIDDAEEKLDKASIEYMLENNVPLYEYPLKFDEYFLKNNLNILQQIHNNTRIKFQFGGESPMALFVKQINIKWGDNILPQYDITLADDIEVVLNQIGQVTEDVSSLRVQMSEMQKYYAQNLINDISSRLSRIQDDIALGKITFQQGLDSIGSLILHSDIKSSNYQQGMTDQGRGWRIDELGNAEVESIRVRSFMEIMELLVNRLQAQEGDTAFTDNDQIDYVEEIEESGTTYYRLTFKDKWSGYFTSQKKGNILKGVANTLAANLANVSDVDENAQGVSYDGNNSYYTSWMQVIRTHNEDDTLGSNQVVVSLYADNLTPANKNFPPCELMTIIRWGHVPQQGESNEEIARLQRSFVLSNTDGRITKLVGVNSPILNSTNYGTTLGTLPQWVLDNYATVRSRYQQGRDYLYAQGIVVEDFIKIDANHQIVIDYIDKGTWTTGQHYLVADPEQGILETHDVWYEGQGWRCKQSHESNSNNYPQKDSAFWELLVKKGEDGTSISIKGVALKHYETWSDLIGDSSKIVGETYLVDERDDGEPRPMIVIWEQGTTGGVAQQDDDYLVQEDGHLYVAKDLIGAWVDVGQLKGDKGDDGQSTFAVELDSNVDTIEVNLDSTVRDYRKTIHIRAYYGNTNVLSACNITWATSDPDIEVSRSSDAITIEVDEGTTFSPANTITFTVAHPTYGNRTVVFSLNTVEKGQDGTNGQDGQKGDKGDQGKMGKNYYYGGVFDTSRQDTFTANDQETPYFIYNNNKWVYIGDNFTEYNLRRIQSEKGYPQDNGNWQIMVTDFKYLISQAIFSNFASLGSFIISGDWMISQNGTVNGVASTDYNLFDPLHPNDNTGNNFIPAYAIDGLTGKAYINDAKVKGSIYANNGEFQGLMQNSMYSPWHSLADVQDKSYDNNFTTLNDQTYKIDSTIKNAGRILRFSSHDLLNDYGNRATLVLQGNDIDPQTGQPINAEYFYYHGIAVKQLYLNDEVVELLGLGTANKFLGWLVLDKKNVLNDKGLPLNVFVKAIVNADGTIYTSSISDSRGLFRVEKVSTGTYRITLPNALLSKRLTIVGGINSDDKRHVFFSSVKVTTIGDLQYPYFIAETTDMSGDNVDCAFNFYVHDTSTL